MSRARPPRPLVEAALGVCRPRVPGSAIRMFKVAAFLIHVNIQYAGIIPATQLSTLEAGGEEEVIKVYGVNRGCNQ